MRKLASIQKIKSLVPIEGADRIELAVIGGWQCVVAKGEFAEGDLGVYFEIDSIPPDRPEFAFLWDKKGEGKAQPEKFRIRTIKLRGKLSQGLLMPLGKFALGGDELHEGLDVTDLLGVAKYEPPIPTGSGEIVGAFPSVAVKTDQPRVQSNLELLEAAQGMPVSITQKFDGTSATYCVDLDGVFKQASRNWSVSSDSMYGKIASRYNLESICSKTGVVIQGEICGPGIQKNPLGLSDLGFFVFGVFDSGFKFNIYDQQAFCATHGLNSVPRVLAHDEFRLDLSDLLDLADNQRYAPSGDQAEGIVVEVLAGEDFASEVDFSFKVISNNFLLKEKD